MDNLNCLVYLNSFLLMHESWQNYLSLVLCTSKFLRVFFVPQSYLSYTIGLKLFIHLVPFSSLLSFNRRCCCRVLRVLKVNSTVFCILERLKICQKRRCCIWSKDSQIQANKIKNKIKDPGH